MATRNDPDESLADRSIVVSRVVNAPRELVWQAMTEPAHIVHWWGPRGFTTTIGEMDVRLGGAWRHIMRGPDGTEYPNSCIFTEVLKPERLSFSNEGRKKGGPHVEFEATWTFESLAAGSTRVTIRMVFPTAGDRDKIVREYGAIEGAKQTLERLSEHLPKMVPADGDFVITRVFDAPRDLVFKAWTEADHLARWFGPKGSTIRVAKLELRPGGVFHFSMGFQGREMWGRWVFREIAPPEWIVLVNSFSDENGELTRHPMVADWPLEMLTTSTFSENGGKTAVTVRWSPLNPTEAERKAFDGGRDSMTMGWTGTFEQLSDYLSTLTR